MADDIKALLPLQPTTFHILLSLADEDRHGYAIILEVARRTQGELKLSAGTLYRSIQRMLETGLIVETRNRPAPEMDDERRQVLPHYPVGKSSCRGGGRTPKGFAQDGALVRCRAEDDLMNFYRLLLHLYPSSFRVEYGDEMSAIFSIELGRSVGLAAKCGFWLSTIAEILFNAAMVHWEIARRDLFHSTRSLLRSPGFTLTAILLVTIGIGANVAVFTLANFVLVRPLPFPEAGPADESLGKPPGLFKDGTFSGQLSRYHCVEPVVHRLWRLTTSTPMSLVGQGEPQRIEGCSVTANLFSVLKRPVLIGRYFSKEDDRGGAPGTVVLSYSLWQAAFGGDREIIGKPISLDDESYTVIGVMPRRFSFSHTRDTILDAFPI